MVDRGIGDSVNVADVAPFVSMNDHPAAGPTIAADRFHGRGGIRLSAVSRFFAVPVGDGAGGANIDASAATGAGTPIESRLAIDGEPGRRSELFHAKDEMPRDLLASVEAQPAGDAGRWLPAQIGMGGIRLDRRGRAPWQRKPMRNQQFGESAFPDHSRLQT